MGKKSTSLTSLLGWTLLFLLIVSGLGYFFIIHPLIDSDMSRTQSRPKVLLKTLPERTKDPVGELVQTVDKKDVSRVKIQADTDPLKEMMIQPVQSYSSASITGHVLQVGSFSQASGAQREKQNLEKKGFNVRIQETQGNSGTYYRVQVVGDFANKSELDQVKARLNKESISFIEKRPE